MNFLPHFRHVEHSDPQKRQQPASWFNRITSTLCYAFASRSYTQNARTHCTLLNSFQPHGRPAGNDVNVLCTRTLIGKCMPPAAESTLSDVANPQIHNLWNCAAAGHHPQPLPTVHPGPPLARVCAGLCGRPPRTETKPGVRGTRTGEVRW